MNEENSAVPTDEESTETIGQRIARFRKLSGLTQQQLADRVGIARILVSDYERGRIRLFDEMVGRVAQALGISSDELLGLAPKPSVSPQVSLRFLRRLAIIETFPEAKKKHILRTLDDSIKANSTDLLPPLE